MARTSAALVQSGLQSAVVPGRVIQIARGEVAEAEARDSLARHRVAVYAATGVLVSIVLHLGVPRRLRATRRARDPRGDRSVAGARRVDRRGQVGPGRDRRRPHGNQRRWWPQRRVRSCEACHCVIEAVTGERLARTRREGEPAAAERSSGPNSGDSGQPEFACAGAAMRRCGDEAAVSLAARRAVRNSPWSPERASHRSRCRYTPRSFCGARRSIFACTRSAPRPSRVARRLL
jgi:hypothetical protein